ncbi:MAG: hypothetical protein V4692_10145 [Bdellovibrionota bacterium]
MGNDVTLKAKMILAGLAALPGIATAAANDQVQANVYCSPYSESGEASDMTAGLTGLTANELCQAQNLVGELNRLDVVVVEQMKLKKAVTVPYRYNIPDPSDIAAARETNLERLVKLRKMIEAAK